MNSMQLNRSVYAESEIRRMFEKYVIYIIDK